MFQSCDNRSWHYDHHEFEFHFVHLEILIRGSAKALQTSPIAHILATHLIEEPFGIPCPADRREFDEFQLVRESAVIVTNATVTSCQGGGSWPNIDCPKVAPL